MKFKPLVDKLFWIITVPTILLLLPLTLISFFSPMALIITATVDLLTVYLLISPLFGYAELRESSLFIKYGIILKKEIPYSKIRDVQKDRKFYSESMMSLKNAFEHINIKYNSFDVTTISVINNDGFILELNKRCCKNSSNA